MPICHDIYPEIIIAWHGQKYSEIPTSVGMTKDGAAPTNFTARRPVWFLPGRLRFLQPLKMQLANAATVGLGHSHAVIVDLYLLALFREMAKQVCDITANRAYVRTFQFELGEIVQLVEPERAVHRKFIRVDLFEFFLVGKIGRASC